MKNLHLTFTENAPTVIKDVSYKEVVIIGEYLISSQSVLRICDGKPLGNNFNLVINWFYTQSSI